MLTFLTGFIASMAHVATGPDHLAAVTPLAIDSRKKSWVIGFSWGVGHTVGMLLIGALFIVFREFLPVEAISRHSDTVIGFLLIGIGIWALARLYRRHSHGYIPHAHFHTRPFLYPHIHKHTHQVPLVFEEPVDHIHPHKHRQDVQGDEIFMKDQANQMQIPFYDPQVQIHDRRAHTQSHHDHVHGEHDHGHFHTHDLEPDYHPTHSSGHVLDYGHGHSHTGKVRQNAFSAFLIGTVHGFAGFSHLFALLPSLALPTIWASVIYIVAFAAGTIVTMIGFAFILGIVAHHSEIKDKQLFLKWFAFTGAVLAIAIGILWIIHPIG